MTDDDEKGEVVPLREVPRPLSQGEEMAERRVKEDEETRFRLGVGASYPVPESTVPPLSGDPAQEIAQMFRGIDAAVTRARGEPPRVVVDNAKDEGGSDG